MSQFVNSIIFDDINGIVQFPIENILYINIEKKQVPFLFAKKIKQVRPNVFKNPNPNKNEIGFVECLYNAIHNPDKKIDCVIVDSLTRVGELLYEYVNKTNEGWKVWDAYKDEIHNVVYNISMDTHKPVIWIALEQQITMPNGTSKNAVMIQGSSKTKIESYFSNVLWTSISSSDKIEDTYKFQVASSQLNPSAKTCPVGLYSEKIIPNNVAKVLYDVYKKYDINSAEDIEKSGFYTPNILVAGASGTGKTYSLNDLFKV